MIFYGIDNENKLLRTLNIVSGFSLNDIGIGQQAKAYVSPLPTKVMTDQNKRIYNVPDTGFSKYMYVIYMICMAFIKAYKL